VGLCLRKRVGGERRKVKVMKEFGYRYHDTRIRFFSMRHAGMMSVYIQEEGDSIIRDKRIDLHIRLLVVYVAKLVVDRVHQLRGCFRFGFEPQTDRFGEGDVG
jgi:hypothetical protein